MAIHEWPELERPRERFVKCGPGALSDAELLAIIIGSGSRGRSAVDVGRALLKRFGSLRGLLTAERRACLRQLGIGPVRFVMLQAALELARRHYLQPLTVGPSLVNPGEAQRFLLAQLRDRKYEVFCCLHVDARGRLIAFEELFRGTVDAATVYPREIARQVVLHNSQSVILAHNHPSGVAEPSSADELMTVRIREALGLLGVRVLDHLIVGDGRCVSLAEREPEKLGVSSGFGDRVSSSRSRSCRGSLSGEAFARSNAMATNAVSSDPTARLDVFCVAEYMGDDRRRHKRWTKIGTAFPHRDGSGGMNVLLDALPPDKNLVILPRGDEKNETGAQEERAAE